jgi:hypothetical protein
MHMLSSHALTLRCGINSFCRVLAFLMLAWAALCSANAESTVAQTINQSASQTLIAADARWHQPAPGSPPLRIAPLRLTETPEGSRATITSDAPFDDYKAYRDGYLFHVIVQHAVASFTSTGTKVRGVSSVRVEQQGEDVRISFQLEHGTAVHIKKVSNQLELNFTVPAQPPAADASPRPVTSNAAGGASSPEGNAEREELRQMRAQMEQLEARIKELEGRQAKHDPPQAAVAMHPPESTGAPDATITAAQVPASDSEHDSMLTGTPHLQIQGFADVNFLASNDKGKTSTFALGQLDLFITSQLSEKFSVLAELILEANQRNEFSTEVHRLLLKYHPNDYFSLSAGRYHTSIGYYNTAYHHGSWFATAADRPFIFAFEGKGGILPLHNVGLSATGRIPHSPFGLRYVAEIGNGRASRSRLDQAVQTAVDENNGKAFNLGLFARPSSFPGFQTGISVYRDRLTPLGLPSFGQTIIAGHLVYQNARYELLNELVLVRHVLRGRLFQTPGFYSQVARRFGNAKPYFRYQYINVPSDDPIYFDVGRRNGPSVGLRYDLTDFAAFKAQYNYTQRRGRSSVNDLILQLAFTF